MAEVNTDIYKQQNPLGNLANILGVLNAAQQLQQNQIQTKQQQFNLNKSQAEPIINTLGSLAARGDVNKATALGNVAAIIKSQQIPGEIAGPLLRQLYNSPDDPKVIQSILGNYYAIMSGTGGGQPVTGAMQPGTFAPQTTPLAQRVTQGTQPVQPGPKAEAAARATGAGAAGMLVDQTREATDYANQVNPLEQAIPALERLGPTKTGPGTEEFNTMKKLAITFGYTGKWQNDAEDFDTAQKYLVQQARTFGNTATNDQLAAAFSGNPNMKMTNAAAVHVGKTLLALRKMKHMQLLDFYNSGEPDENFGRFASRWNSIHDPRAFGFDHMTVEQRKAVLKTVKDPIQFKQDVQDAKDAGVLNPMLNR